MSLTRTLLFHRALQVLQTDQRAAECFKFPWQSRLDCIQLWSKEHISFSFRRTSWIRRYGRLSLCLQFIHKTNAGGNADLDSW